jgi:hypothetical protein
MRRSKKTVFIAVSLTSMVLSAIMVAGCAQTVEQQEPDITAPVERYGRGEMPIEMMTEVAAVLGIEPQELEEAFAQAQNELAEIPVEERSPDALLSRVAEILGIEQQELQDVMAQVRGEGWTDASRPETT